MNVSDAIRGDPSIRALCRRLGASKTPHALNGLWGSAAPIAAALLAESLARPLLYITAHLEQADNARDDIETILSRGVALLPAWETLPGEGSGANEIGDERARMCAALHRCGARANGDSEKPDASSESPHHTIIAPIQAIMQPVPSPACLDANSLTLAVGMEQRPEEISAWLTDRGFGRLDQVEQPGDFALRGGILDIFFSADTDPVRVEFFGDQIESIRQFEVGSQRSMQELTSARITRSPDLAKTRASETTSFLNYLAGDRLVVLHEPLEVAETARTVYQRLGRPAGHDSFEIISKRLRPFGQLHLSRFPAATVPESRTFSAACEPVPPFDPKATDAVRQLGHLAADQGVVVFCDNEGERDRLAELIRQDRGEGVDAEPQEQPNDRSTSASRIEMRIGLIHGGFRWQPSRSTIGRPQAGALPDSTPASPALSEAARGDSQAAGSHQRSFIVLPHHELFRRYTQRRRMRRVTAGRPFESLLDLEKGDYVVHVAHGAAKYVGMRTMRKGRSRKSEEFLTLRFADSATMHVPVSQIDLVQKYVGARAARPALAKLGGTRWQSTKAKVEEAITDFAAELLGLQAQRELQAGIAFPRDTDWQNEFDSAFLYTETPDQSTAVQEIKTDQMRVRPMDRLLCGDVGYGKTELAMRAAFKTVEFGKQVAVLVPTTVLAEQHFRTFKERLADYPFLIACLSRFQSARGQREITTAAKKGHMDILIGTHRLLSKDVEFADLGLVIVDEEQRFGVEHKERLKRLRAAVDVLTLTATPIPRTLHMAMVGLRDISSLATPPMDRRSIATQVCGWSDQLIRDAIIRELNRDGQVYFVHNRVKSIKTAASRIASLVPEARMVIGHGQMSGDELEDVMLRFVRHDADILVCTTIIEAGLDIPNANTIFIDRADMFGLADLHQLRGRVGRYKHRAYCYLLLSPDRPITQTAARRLKAIEQYSDLGAGFRIAMRDLEIRGAGNILGAEQSGHIAAVGYELYCQLLDKTVRRMKGEPHRERVTVHLELEVESYIPRAYIASDRQRMECYRRFAACQNGPDVERLADDLKDAFGSFPKTVETLLTLADIRVRAAAAGLRAIIRHDPDVIFKFNGEIKRFEPLFASATGDLSFPDGQTIHWRLPDHYFHGETLLVVLRNLFRPQRRQTAPASARQDVETVPERRLSSLSRRRAGSAPPVGKGADRPPGGRTRGPKSAGPGRRGKVPP